MQIETVMRYPYTPTRMAKIWGGKGGEKDVKQLEFSNTTGGNVKW